MRLLGLSRKSKSSSSTTSTPDDSAVTSATRSSSSQSLYSSTASLLAHQQDFGPRRPLLHADDDQTSTNIQTATFIGQPSHDTRLHAAAAASFSSSASTLGKRSFFRRARSKSNATSVDQHAPIQSQSPAKEASSRNNALAYSVTHPSIDTSHVHPHPLRSQTFVDDSETNHVIPNDNRPPSASPTNRRSVFGFVARKQSSYRSPATAEIATAPSSETIVKHKRSQPSLSGVIRPVLKSKQTESETGSSFQLHSFRLATTASQPAALAPPCTLSALVQDEVAASPVLSKQGDVFMTSPTTSRPQSPITTDTGYSDEGHDRPVRSRQASGSGSITVAKFREAKAARSTSSLHSNNGTSLYSGGLNLDLPPRLSLDPNHRSASFNSLYGMQDAIQEVVERVSDAPTYVNTISPSYALSSPPETRSGFIVESRRGIFPTTAQRSPHSPPPPSGRSPLGRSTMSDHGHTAIPPSKTPYYLRSRRMSSASTASAGSNLHRVSMALHPDVALPLPPIPTEPAKRISTAGSPTFVAGDGRRTSVQSVSSVASVFGSWLSAQSANIGLATAVEEVTKIVSPEKSTAVSPPKLASLVRNSTTSPMQQSAEDQRQCTWILGRPSETTTTPHMSVIPAVTSNRSGNKQSTASNEQEILAFTSHASIGPLSVAWLDSDRQEDIDILGGKVLPAPPSATPDDMSIVSSATTLSTLAYTGDRTTQTSIPSRSPSMSETALDKVRSAANLFTHGLLRLAKPAGEDSDSNSGDELPKVQDVASAYATARATPVDAQSRSASQTDVTSLQTAVRKPIAARDLFGGSDSESDISSGEDINNSDDSATKARKVNKSRIAPPPRPKSRASAALAAHPGPASSALPVTYAYSPAGASPLPSVSAAPAFQTTVRLLSPSQGQGSTVLLQPTAQRTVLTTQALKNLTVDDSDDVDDDELPLTIVTQKRVAKSDLGAGHRSALETSSARRAYRVINSGSSTSIGLTRSPYSAASTINSSVASSMGLQHRSLSGLSMTSSRNALQPSEMQRSFSAQAVPTLGSSGPPSVTLSSLIAAEMAGDKHHQHRGTAFPFIPQARRSSPSSSIGSSMLNTPSELSMGHPHAENYISIADNVPRLHTMRPSHCVAMSETGWRISHGMQTAKAASTTSSPRTDGKRQSVPLAQFKDGGAHNRMKARHREEALKHAMDGHRNLQTNATDGVYHGPMPMVPTLAPLPLHGMSCPPGVDPLLYASLPADQKLALQQRSQQMLAIMESYAMQASSANGLPMIAIPFQPYVQMGIPPFSNTSTLHPSHHTGKPDSNGQ